MSFTNFRKLVWAHYRKAGRHDLPWRQTRDPYKILVSEVMLQQTRVERVLPFYAGFMRRWPDARTLAAAPLSDVLKAWQGLGYNRRAKLLHAAAKQLCLGTGILKLSYRTKLGYKNAEIIRRLEELPGVGRYTARAVAAFAFGADEVFVETNIRTAVTHHFFLKPRSRGTTMIYHSGVSDAEIAEVLRKVAPKKNAREWNYALMDYGAYLKRAGVRVNAQSKHYAKQTKFAGSLREARGAILKELSRAPRPSFVKISRGVSEARLLGLLGNDRRGQLASALRALASEGLVQKTRERYALAC